MALGLGNCYRLLFLEEHHVGSVLSARDGEDLSIRRPLKFGNMLRTEVGDLMSKRTVERLHKNMIHAPVANDVGHGLSVRSEGHPVGEASASHCSQPWVGLQQPRSRGRT
jgi:hypothetical protein